LLLTLALAGCHLQETPTEGSTPPPQGSIPAAPEIPPKPAPLTGTVTFENAGTLTETQQAAISAYFTRYYESVGTLEAKSVADIFVENIPAMVASNDAYIEATVGFMSMYPADMCLSDYSTKLKVSSVSDQGGGTVRVALTEDTVHHFKECPEEDATYYNLSHVFWVSSAAEGNKLSLHYQEDALYKDLMGGYYGQALTSSPDAESYINTQKENFLAGAKANIDGYSTQGSENDVSAATPYNREASVAYALEWINKRNTQWPDFSLSGGNCQNLASQTLNAGGIPMDTQGVSWFLTSSGRSESWAYVPTFLSYAQSNTGSGLAANANAPYYSAEPGDLMVMGFREGGWRHTAVITGVVKNEEGNTIDYLISCNTADKKQMPAAAYYYTARKIVKIQGSN
jgi:hypothetical protein